jgi:hypothetical protein
VIKRYNFLSTTEENTNKPSNNTVHLTLPVTSGLLRYFGGQMKVIS